MQKQRGEITQTEWESEIEDERDAITAELLTLEVFKKATIQRAANAALNGFYKKWKFVA